MQAALLEGLLIPEGDRCVRLTEYDHDAFIAPTGKGATYTLVEVTLFSGRSLDAKRRLYRAMVEQLGRLIRCEAARARLRRAARSDGRASKSKLNTAAASWNSSSAPRMPRRCNLASPRFALASANIRSTQRHSRIDRL